MEPSKKKLVVVGAGISGLSLAWYLLKQYGKAISLTIIDKSSRIGGCIQTIEQDGFAFELGPRSCRPKGSGIATLQLIEELGLQREVIIPSRYAKKRYLYLNKRLTPLPHSLFTAIFSSFAKTFLCASFKDLSTPSKCLADDTIYDFSARRFGKDFATHFFDPLALGIFAGDIRKLSIRSCFPKLFEMEKLHGSVLKGLFLTKSNQPKFGDPFIGKMQNESLFSLQGGMQTLVDELYTRLKDHIITDCSALTVDYQGSTISIETNHGRIEADRVFFAIPAKPLAALLKPHNDEVYSLLTSIPYENVTVVNLGYHRNVLGKQGFGYLVPTRENEEILGTVFDSSIFPQQNKALDDTRLTVMMHAGDKNPLEVATRAVKLHLNIEEKPDFAKVTIIQDAIPQYYVGHCQKIERLESIMKSHFPNMTVIGNAFYGVSVNDCIAKAKETSKGQGTLGTSRH